MSAPAPVGGADTPGASGPLGRFLGLIERAGNALPHPATLFALMAVVVLVVSAVLAGLEVSVPHPTRGTEVKVVSLLSLPELHWILGSVVANFAAFPPLGSVVVALLGVAVAEASGLIGAALRATVLAAPRRWLTPVVVFCGLMSNAGGDVGYVLFIPLSGMIFLAIGRHPVLGMAAAFAGVSGGFSANLLLGTVDPLLAGITQAAAAIKDPAYAPGGTAQVTAAANWTFMAAATPILTLAGWWVTERIVAPRLGAYTGAEKPVPLVPLEAAERRGLWAAAVTWLLLTGLVAWGLGPADGFLRLIDDPKTAADESANLLRSPFLTGITVFIFIYGLAGGLAYGLVTRSIRRDGDVMAGMTRSMETMANYFVLVFFCAQFIAWFNRSNIGLVIAVEGAALLQPVRDQPILLMVGFVLLTATFNLIMGSASAKWTLLAPIFVPLFMILGYSPELVQGAYRVGDSVTNPITPLMNYFPVVLAFVQRYEPKAGIGTLSAAMLPYSVVFLVVWSLLLAVFILLSWPLGPGAGLFLPAAPGG